MKRKRISGKVARYTGLCNWSRLLGDEWHESSCRIRCWILNTDSPQSSILGHRLGGDLKQVSAGGS